jgi:hypothetical protein
MVHRLPAGATESRFLEVGVLFCLLAAAAGCGGDSARQVPLETLDPATTPGAVRATSANSAAESTSASSSLPVSEGSQTGDADTTDERAAEICEKLLANYRDASSYADNASYLQFYVLRGEGVERELPFFQMSLAFERPNRLRLRFEEAVAGEAGRQAYDIACDGQTLRCASAALPGQIQQVAAPERLTVDNCFADSLVREAVLMRSIENVFPQLAMLLNDDDDQTVFPLDEDPRLMDEAELRGRRCHRVATRSEAGQRVFWIDAQTSVLMRMELPVDNQREALDPENQYLRLKVWIDFLDATRDAQIAPASFEMPVGEGVRLVRNLVRPPQPGISARLEDRADSLAALKSAAEPTADPGPVLDTFYRELAEQAIE